MVASTTVIIIIGFLIYMVLYWTYGKKIEKDVVKADDKNAPPSQRLYDGVDYVPAHKAVLFGHHFSSIAGAGPLVGPAMAMVWGWLPGLLWVWFGNVLIGSIHDYLALMASVRYDAKSVQFVATDLISKRTGKSFYWIVFFLLILVVAAFANVIGSMFARTPSIGSASIFMTFAAIILGVLIYRLKMNLTVATIIGIVLMSHRHLAGAPVPAAHELRDVDGHPVRLHHHRGIHPGEPPAAAAGLPELVFALLRHRHRLYRRHSDLQGDGGAGVLRLRARPAGRPAHALLARDPAGHRLRVPLRVPLPGGLGDVVQAAPEGDRTPSSWATAAMFTEGFLSTVIIVAIGGFGMTVMQTQAAAANYAMTLDAGNWATTYAKTTGALKLAPPSMIVEAFGVMVASTFLSFIPTAIVKVIAGLWISAFALTTLDTTNRLARYCIVEMLEPVQDKLGGFYNIITNRWVASFIPAFLGIYLAWTGQFNILWPSFSAANQLIASIALMTGAAFVSKKLQSKFAIVAIIPAWFLWFTVTCAIVWFMWVVMPGTIAKTPGMGWTVQTIMAIMLVLNILFIVDFVKSSKKKE